ncbi:MAG: Mrp/NBP35 family ATP-binding protein [Bacteroidetes bacterium]|nr:Mrp/NBP35 family ATP-binding protein [Bacteroidota bacterium]MBU1720313.1 Mrp/NBP35 family ATP-binding protein [Bacteroidota bacterium]
MGTYSKEAVIDALSRVLDPDFKKDLVSLNMIEGIEIDRNTIRFSLVLTTPACPFQSQMKEQCIASIHDNIDSDANVEVTVTSRVTAGKNRGMVQLPGVKNIIGVASGKGGVGKSTVAVNLAISLAKTGAKVGLLDADIYGPSVPLMLDLQDAIPETITEGDRTMILPVEKYGLKVLSIGFFVDPNKALVWRGPMASNALKQMLTDSAWDDIDYLVVDLPPGTGDIQLTLAQTVPVNGIVVVSTPQDVALADARKSIEMFKGTNLNIPVLGLVENMSWFSPAELPNNKYYIFGKEGCMRLSKETGLPFLGQIPLIMSIREGGDLGLPVSLHSDSAESSYFSALAANVAREIAIKNAKIEDIPQHKH